MSNNNKFNIEQLAEIFGALSNPNRLKIFQRLITCCKPGTVGLLGNCQSAYIGELGGDLNIVPSTVSHHIKELRRAGLIRTERRGQKIACWVDPGQLRMLSRFFDL